jgi:Trp operon repressor
MRRETQSLMETSGLSEEVCHNLLYPDAEEHTVRIIKQHLLTPDQRAKLAARFISIEDLLNGRVEGDQGIYDEIFSVWNAKLGRRMFGF